MGRLDDGWHTVMKTVSCPARLWWAWQLLNEEMQDFVWPAGASFVSPVNKIILLKKDLSSISMKTNGKTILFLVLS